MVRYDVVIIHMFILWLWYLRSIVSRLTVQMREGYRATLLSAVLLRLCVFDGAIDFVAFVGFLCLTAD